jgi:hypothetical protein
LPRFTATQTAASPGKPRPNAYRKVLDSRKRRVRGVWQRSGHYYANLTVADDLGRKTSRRVLLAGASFDDPAGHIWDCRWNGLKYDYGASHGQE